MQVFLVGQTSASFMLVQITKNNNNQNYDLKNRLFINVSYLWSKNNRKKNKKFYSYDTKNDKMSTCPHNV